MKTLICIALLMPICAGAEEIKMKDGSMVKGELGKFTPETIEIKTEKGTLVVPLKTISYEFCLAKIPKSTEADLAKIIKGTSQSIQEISADLEKSIKASEAEPDWKKIAADLSAENRALRIKLGEVPGNEISAAISAIRERAAEKYPNDYQMQVWEIEHETEAYFRLHPMAKTALSNARAGLEPKQTFLQRELSKGSALDRK